MESLDTRYVNYSKLHKVTPNPEVLCTLSKLAKNNKRCQRRRRLLIKLDHLQGADILPVIDVINTMHASDADAIDIVNESPCTFNEDHLLTLLCAANGKLHTLTLQDLPFTKHFLRDLFRCGLACRILKLNSSSLQKLDMVGRFMQLRKLDLDFCTSLTTLHKDCFSHMPQLMHLSICESRITNLWTTTAALSKLPSLTELRFQNCLCCEDTSACPAYSSKISGFGVNEPDYHIEKEIKDSISLYYSSINCDILGAKTHPTKICSDHLKRLHLLDLSSNCGNLSAKNKDYNMQSSPQDGCDTLVNELSSGLTDAPGKKYISHHPSPICFEKHYREFMISSLPQLAVLDNLPIGRMDRKLASEIYSKYFECLPYKRQKIESVAHILHNREIGSGSIPRRKNQNSSTRSFCATMLGASPWPLLQPISSISCMSSGESKSLRPRQFEYHPSNSSQMAFGTLDGEVAVINHENGKIVAYMPPSGSRNSILGLCWLKKYPSKLLAGSDSGLLRLFDISNTEAKDANYNHSANSIVFDKFEQLTSVHINSTDEQFLVSGYTKSLAVYDISTGRRLQTFNNLHEEPINVAKFAHHSPFMFATASFDRDVKMWDLRQNALRPCFSATSSRGNVMACFSPDDQYLLVSAVDNEVKQLLAVDGRLHTDFEIASSGSPHNYTRSYYMNGQDYIISGSSDEHVVRICCSQTGRRLRDVYFEGRGSDKSMFVQSLRSDSFREFNMSILASYAQSNSKCDIIKVNMLSSSEDGDENANTKHFQPSFGLGG